MWRERESTSMQWPRGIGTGVGPFGAAAGVAQLLLQKGNGNGRRRARVACCAHTEVALNALLVQSHCSASLATTKDQLSATIDRHALQWNTSGASTSSILVSTAARLVSGSFLAMTLKRK